MADVVAFEAFIALIDITIISLMPRLITLETQLRGTWLSKLMVSPPTVLTLPSFPIIRTVSSDMADFIAIETPH